MTRTSQKQAEKRYVERFLELDGIEPSASLREGDRVPDLVVPTSAGEIGVEVTELFRETPEGELPRQALESLRRRVQDDLTQRWQTEERPPLLIWLHFKRDVALRPSDVAGLVDQVDAIVEKHVPDPGNFAELADRWEDRSWFPEQLVRIKIFHRTDSSNSHCSVLDVASVPFLSADLLQRAIDPKNIRAPGCKAGVVEGWLLIVADGRRLSSSFEIPADTLSHQYVSEFDRTLLFDPLRDEYFELQTD